MCFVDVDSCTRHSMDEKDIKALADYQFVLIFLCFFQTKREENEIVHHFSDYFYICEFNLDIIIFLIIFSYQLFI